MTKQFITPKEGMPTAYVLGARPGSNNIGDAVSKWFWGHDWGVIQDDAVAADAPDPDTRPRGVNADEPVRRGPLGYGGANGWERYEAPSVQDFEKADASALVITLGRTYKDRFTEVPDYLIEQMIRANLILPLEAARRFVQAREKLKASNLELVWDDDETAKIIFVGSYAHNHPFTNGTLYCAAKAGLNMAARTLGWELTNLGYRVHVVHPYHVNGTPMWAQVEEDVMRSKGMTWEEADAYNRKDLKMPDLLTPQEVANVIGTLVTNRSMDWVTGPVELYGGSR
jgi:NAD(P)-dependent dehydrogenase (short-subunit alcohol dehydrogenase family)